MHTRATGALLDTLRITIVAAVFSVLAFPSSADAWQCVLASCPGLCNAPITYAIGELPADVDENEGIAAIQRAFDDWNEPGCVDLQFEYRGRAAQLTEPAAIVVGTVPWSEELGGPTTWAWSPLLFRPDGCTVPSSEPNIMLNDDDWIWSTDGSADFTTSVDLYTAVLDRVGVMLGIRPSFMDAVTVVTFTHTEVVDGIGPRDVDAVCWLYADGDVAPTNYMPPELPPQCTECTTAADCGDGEVCLPFGDDIAACIATCEEGDACPGDGQCLVIDGADEAYCLALTDSIQATCPDLGTEPGDDMGSVQPDMGTSEPPDMAAGPTPDMGSPPAEDEVEADSGQPGSALDDATVGGGGCSTASSQSHWLSLLLLGLLFRRRSM